MPWNTFVHPPSRLPASQSNLESCSPALKFKDEVAGAGAVGFLKAELGKRATRSIEDTVALDMV
jgi:hypothetical protein